MKNRTAMIAVIGVIAVGVALYIRSKGQGELAEQERAVVNDTLSNADGFSNYKAFLESEADGAHHAAKDGAFDNAAIGQAKFDPQKYKTIYLNRLIARAREEKKDDLVKWLKGICDEENITVTS